MLEDNRKIKCRERQRQRKRRKEKMNYTGADVESNKKATKKEKKKVGGTGDIRISRP